MTTEAERSRWRDLWSVAVRQWNTGQRRDLAIMFAELLRDEPDPTKLTREEVEWLIDYLKNPVKGAFPMKFQILAKCQKLLDAKETTSTP